MGQTDTQTDIATTREGCANCLKHNVLMLFLTKAGMVNQNTYIKS